MKGDESTPKKSVVERQVSGNVDVAVTVRNPAQR